MDERRGGRTPPNWRIFSGNGSERFCFSGTTQRALVGALFGIGVSFIVGEASIAALNAAYFLTNKPPNPEDFTMIQSHRRFLDYALGGSFGLVSALLPRTTKAFVRQLLGKK
jgi:hypothetical protein